MSAIEERIVDRHVLKLLRAMLRAGVMEDGAVTRERDRNAAGRGDLALPVQRLPAPARPAVGRARARGAGALRGRSARDVPDRAGGRGAPSRRLRSILAELGLELKHAKTRIVHLREGGEGLDFLGFHHRWVRGERALSSICGSSPAGPHARRCSTPATGSVSSRRASGCCCRSRRSCRTSTASCAAGRATSATGTPPVTSTKITHHALNRLALFVAKRHQRAPRATAGGSLPTSRRTGSGLISLDGTVVAPRPYRAWRPGTPNAGGEERRRAVCGRTACTVRCGGGRKPALSRPSRASAGASRRPSSERARHALRQDCSFAKQQDSPPALPVVV